MEFAPWVEQLSDRQREALRRATVIAVDECFDDLAVVDERGGNPVDTSDTMFLESALPPAFTPRFSVAFLRSFALSVALVGWKLAQEARHDLACVAEELALKAIIEGAELVMESEGWDPEDFGGLRQETMEDLDVDYLFDPKYDGIAEADEFHEMGIVPMAFDEWFEPFGVGDRGQPHPYQVDGD